MPDSTYTVPGSGDHLALGINWNASVASDVGYSIAPTVWRYDDYDTDNYGGWFDEAMDEPDGTWSTWYEFEFGSGCGWRQLDSFSRRTYQRRASSYSIRLNLYWYSAGTEYDGYFHDVDDGSHTFTVTIPAAAKPNAPSGLSSNRASDTRIYLVWNPSSSYKTAVLIERQTDGGSWSQIASMAANATNYTDTTTSAGHQYRYRVRVTNGVFYSSYATGSTIIYTTPNPPTNLSYTMGSDTRIDLLWTASGSKKTAMLVERQTDGGSWSQIASLSASATSYTDTSTSADHVYKYRVRTRNGDTYSTYATSLCTITTTAAAPTKITLARASGTDVLVTLTNTSRTATSLIWEKRQDGSSTWQDGGTISGKVTSFTAPSLAGVYYIRVKNYNIIGSSAWLTSKSIASMCPPNPPTLVSPSGIISLEQANLKFSWLHNTIDGSGQTEAQLRYKVGDGSWTTISKTTQNSHTMPTSTFSAGSSVTWQVRTKGVDEGYSNWSSTKQFYVYQVPSISFIQDNPPSTVSNMPIPCKVSYSDPQGKVCSSATVSLYEGDSLMFSEPMDINGGTLSASLSVSEFLPVDGKTYKVSVTARSGSTLQSSANTTFTVDYNPPKAATVNVTTDSESGYSTIVVENVPDSEGEEIARIEVYRVTDIRKEIIVPAVIGQSEVDRYAPINKDFYYQVVSYAASGAFTATDVHVTIPSEWFFFLFGQDLAKSKWNHVESITLDRPHRETFYFSGRDFPIYVDDEAKSETREFGTTLVLQSEADAFLRLMDTSYPVIYKSERGEVMRVIVNLSLTPIFNNKSYYGECSVSMTRVDGDDL